MADTIKSVLFVDYDSINRSLKAGNALAAERFAERANLWVAAIESGQLVSPPADSPVRRRILIRRCYADPRRLGKHRAALAANGFEVVECPPIEGRERNSADINMALDTLDALSHPTGYEEFILLSADTDLTAVLLRLRAHNRSTVIYANDATAPSYKAVADGMIEEAPLVALILGEAAGTQPEAAPAARPKPAETSSAERAGIEALARKVSASTSVPLFSPRTFAELFRALTEEIAANGYHFQSTAEHVTAKLAATGRNATRRQVVFVVKGLALKGHVFSTTDTPEDLAEVFREQVLYLAGNAGLDLDEKEKSLLSGWIIGAPTTSTALELERQPAAEAPAKADEKAARRRATKATPTEPAELAKPAAPKAAPLATPRPMSEVRPAPPLRPAAEARTPAASATKPPEPAKRPSSFPKPPETAKPATVLAPRPMDPMKPAATMPTEAPRLQPLASRLAPSVKAASSTPASQTPGILAKPMAPAAPRPTPVPPRAPLSSSPTATPAARPVLPPLRPSILSPSAPVAPRPATPAASTPRPATAKAPARAEAASGGKAGGEPDKAAIESSILAAIAQAVDVLVENSGTTTVAKAPVAPPAPQVRKVEPPPARKPDPAPAPKAQPAVRAESEGDDIGDEIQRIIASYSRDRQPGGERR